VDRLKESERFEPVKSSIPAHDPDRAPDLVMRATLPQRIMSKIKIRSMKKPGAAIATPGLNYYPANAV
jgi:hypothetical protein